MIGNAGHGKGGQKINLYTKDFFFIQKFSKKTSYFRKCVDKEPFKKATMTKHCRFFKYFLLPYNDF